MNVSPIVTMRLNRAPSHTIDEVWRIGGGQGLPEVGGEYALPAEVRAPLLLGPALVAAAV